MTLDMKLLCHDLSHTGHCDTPLWHCVQPMGSTLGLPSHYFFTKVLQHLKWKRFGQVVSKLFLGVNRVNG